MDSDSDGMDLDADSPPQAVPLKVYFDPEFNPCVDTSLHSRFNERFLALLETGAHRDVCLKIGPDETVMAAHSLVLTTASDFFDTAVLGDWAESKNNEIKLLHIEPDVMRLVLQYMYGGAVKMSKSFTKTIGIYDAFKYLCLPEPSVQQTNHPELLDLETQMFSRLLREACQYREADEQIVKVMPGWLRLRKMALRSSRELGKERVDVQGIVLCMGLDLERPNQVRMRRLFLAVRVLPTFEMFSQDDLIVTVLPMDRLRALTGDRLLHLLQWSRQRE
ncbi:hypothetical protein HK097_007815 [Rhizophlyctis rosea]|uniref:BTB domain-containing protein n=1 Tax=Rhizophlyctis rosea TaxID=64517 RepID=A0AAD5SB47_9FUNG|nr:hypothetical protein HK097_007815 [Rhizophlyctis rosea]